MAEQPIEYGARSKYVGEVAEQYDAERRKQDKWELEQSVVRDFVARAQPGQKVLDVPFGTGRFAEIYLDRQLEVHGVDISGDMLDQARIVLGENAGKCALQTSDALDLPFDDDSFDFLVCNRFIKWLPELDLVDRALCEFSRVSRGQMLVQWNVKREKSILSQFADKLTGKGSTGDNVARLSQKTKYREADIVGLCRKNNLEIVEDFALSGRTSGVRYLVLKSR